MKLIRTLLTTSALLLACVAHAAPIIVGSLSRDVANNSPIIIDSLNNRHWLGWDVTKGLTYAQTVAATQVGGQFAGFQIARNLDAQLFVDALVGVGNPCTVSNSAYCVLNDHSPLREQVLGDSLFDYSQLGYSMDFDSVFFLSDNGIGGEVGFIENYTDYSCQSQGRSCDDVYKISDWSSFSTADGYSGNVPYSIGWLLYRAAPTANTPANNVPEPGSLALLAAGLIGAAALRRR